MQLIEKIAIILFGLIIAHYTLNHCIVKWDMKQKTYYIGMIIALTVSVAGVILFNSLFAAINITVLCSIFLYSSCSDIKTREIDDYIHIMLLLCGFIGCSSAEILIKNGIGAIIIFGLLMFSTIISKGSIGGGDIKFAAAATLPLGFAISVLGLFFGLVFSIIYNRLIHKNKEGFPMLPYLSAGYMLALFTVGAVWKFVFIF